MSKLIKKIKRKKLKKINLIDILSSKCHLFYIINIHIIALESPLEESYSSWLLLNLPDNKNPHL